MKQIVHRTAGVTAFLCIAGFFTSTLIVELFCSLETVAVVKSLILIPGIPVLILAMIITGGSGFALAKHRKGKLIEAKQKRMPFIAANGLLVLVPCAIYLDQCASAGTFDTAFYLIQAVEIIAGFTNLTLMSLNIRDGLRLSGRFRKTSQST